MRPRFLDEGRRAMKCSRSSRIRIRKGVWENAHQEVVIRMSSDQNDQFGMVAPQAAIACMVVRLTRTS